MVQALVLLTQASHLKLPNILLFNQILFPKVLFSILAKPPNLPGASHNRLVCLFAFVWKVTFLRVVISSCQANSVPWESHRS
jgi:hypothetical protein